MTEGQFLQRVAWLVRRADLAGSAADNKLAIHPGRVLRDELVAAGLTAQAFAARIGVAEREVTAIMDGERAIGAEMAIRFGLALGTTAHYWMHLQVMHDLKVARAALPADALRIAPCGRCDRTLRTRI